MIYPSTEEIIAVNSKVLGEIKSKKADSHKVLSRAKIDVVLEAAKNKKGDVFDKAVTLLKGLIKAHPFESGNRRTAYVVAESFIKVNGSNSKSDSGKNARMLQGIREDYYTEAEIRDWFIKGEIREFTRK